MSTATGRGEEKVEVSASEISLSKVFWVLSKAE